jgi:RNA polymerase sigma-70 factor (ECF subfamily)
MEDNTGQITILLHRLRTGDERAQSELISLVHDQLHRIARQQLQGERRDHTLQPTALVNELYLRLKLDESIDWQDRKHLFSVVAVTMRRILVDHARARNAQRRPAANRRVDIEDCFIHSDDHPAEFLVLDDALDRLAQFGPRQAEIIRLRYFVGLTVEETARVLGIADRTVKRDWQLARAWLSNLLNQPPESTASSRGSTD